MPALNKQLRKLSKYRARVDRARVDRAVKSRPKFVYGRIKVSAMIRTRLLHVCGDFPRAVVGLGPEIARFNFNKHAEVQQKC